MNVVVRERGAKPRHWVHNGSFLFVVHSQLARFLSLQTLIARDLSGLSGRNDVHMGSDLSPRMTSTRGERDDETRMRRGSGQMGSSSCLTLSPRCFRGHAFLREKNKKIKALWTVLASDNFRPSVASRRRVLGEKWSSRWKLVFWGTF